MPLLMTLFISLGIAPNSIAKLIINILTNQIIHTPIFILYVFCIQSMCSCSFTSYFFSNKSMQGRTKRGRSGFGRGTFFNNLGVDKLILRILRMCKIQPLNLSQISPNARVTMLCKTTSQDLYAQHSRTKHPTYIYVVNSVRCKALSMLPPESDI